MKKTEYYNLLEQYSAAIQQSQYNPYLSQYLYDKEKFQTIQTKLTKWLKSSICEITCYMIEREKRCPGLCDSERMCQSGDCEKRRRLMILREKIINGQSIDHDDYADTYYKNSNQLLRLVIILIVVAAIGYAAYGL